MKVLKELLAIHEAAKVDDEAIFTKVQDAVGSMFDGGDPIDQLIPWMKKTGVTMDDIDNAVKKNVGRGKKKYGMNDWMVDTWADMAADQIYDAENGYVDANNRFYMVSKDGTITPNKNPWK
jgi:hypothetical protein